MRDGQGPVIRGADQVKLAMMTGPERRSVASRAIVAGVLVFLILLVGALGFVISRMHNRDIASARNSLDSFDTLLAEHTSSAFDGVSVVVEQIAQDIEARHLTDPAAIKAEYGGEATFRDIRRHSLDLPQLDAISIVAADGTVVALSRGFPVKPINISDRTYFQRALRPGAPKTFVTNPLINRGDNLTWDIYFVRRIALPDGKLLALVLGAVKLSYFEDLYETVGAAGDMTLSLWRDDGTLLARFPSLPSRLGERYASKRPFALMAPGTTSSAVDVVGADGQRRIIVSRRLADMDLIVDASQTMSDVLHDWRQDASIVIGAGALCAAAGIFLGLLARRHLRAYTALAAAVTAAEAAEQARLLAEEKLAQAETLEAIGRITAGIAHDFNNLLSAILGNGELLQRQLAGTPQAARVAIILDASQRGAALIRQMLAFARKQELSPEPVDLNKLARDTIELVRNSIPAEIVLSANLAPDPLIAYVDPLQIGNALINLVVNARDAMAGPGHITIVTRDLSGAATGPAPMVSIAVEDNGSGMTEEIRQRVFEPFFTTKGAGKGSGLGLSQVYGIAEQSGGYVDLQTAPGAGTTVTIVLPASAPADAASAAPAGAPSPRARTDA